MSARNCGCKRLERDKWVKEKRDRQKERESETVKRMRQAQQGKRDITEKHAEIPTDFRFFLLLYAFTHCARAHVHECMYVRVRECVCVCGCK